MQVLFWFARSFIDGPIFIRGWAQSAKSLTDRAQHGRRIGYSSTRDERSLARSTAAAHSAEKEVGQASPVPQQTRYYSSLAHAAASGGSTTESLPQQSQEGVSQAWHMALALQAERQELDSP